jgi:hypothetical protein
MWVGEGAFDSFGYQKPNAHIRGKVQKLDPDQCYLIKDEGPPNGSEQYKVVPVDKNGHVLGPAAFATAGQVMYSIWEQGSRSPEYDISNRFIG